MANFLLSITDPVTGEPDVVVSSGVLSVEDHANYTTTTEVGHAAANFTGFYKMKITLPNGDDYLYSSIGDGDAVITTPSAGAPSIDYTYSTGDGQYFITVYTLPTYGASVAYVYSTSNPVYVYKGTKIYKNIQTGTGQDPATATAYWTEVTDIDLLPSKYRLEQRIVIYSDIKRSYARRIYNSNVVNQLIGDNWEKLFKDPEFIVAVQLFISINSIPVLLAAARYSEIDTTINFAKTISAKYEVI
jgi:hypothetical protein